jgi:hypothetical protein
MMAKTPATKRKQFNLDANVVNALEALARDNGDSLDQLADFAFRDLLKKLGRPVSLREALQVSARALPANDREPKRSRKKA